MNQPATLPPFLTRLGDMDAAWAEPSPAARLDAVRNAGQRLRQRLLEAGRVRAVRTFPINAFPYPTTYGLSGAARSLAPFVILRNAMQLVQVECPAHPRGLVNVLINPTDPDRATEAPFFAQQ